MGKKQNKLNASPQSVVQNRDIMQRMNFLWQASVYLERVSNCASSGSGSEGWMKGGESGEGEGEGEEGERRGEGEERQVEEEKKEDVGIEKGRRKTMTVESDLAKVYIQMMKCVGKRTTTGM